MTDSPARPSGAPRRFWPTRPSDLVDTTLCPSCFRRLDGAVCGSCGLDLRTPLSADLLALGRSIVRVEEERQFLIAVIRREATRRADVPAGVVRDASAVTAPVARPANTAPDQPTAWAAPVASSPVAPAPLGVQATSGEGGPPPGLAPPERAAPTGPPAPRRSAGQILLLTAGVVLVSVAAIFFSVLAYVVATIELRSILTAVASLVVLGIAWALRARRLVGTAEGIAVIGVVLLLLDVWIVRANRLFDVDRLDAWMYTGVAFAVLSVVLLGISRRTGLRAPSLSAVVIGPFAAFALVMGATAPLTGAPTRVVFAAVAVMVLGLIELVPIVPREERVLLRVSSLLAGSVALLASIAAFPLIPAGPVIGYAIVTAGWSISVAVAHRVSERLSGPAWPVLAGIGLALAVCGIALSGTEELATSGPTASGWRPVLLIAAVCVLALVARGTGAAVRRTLHLAAAIVTVVGTVAIAPAAGFVLEDLVDAVTAPWFRAGPLDRLVDADGVVAAASGIAVSALLTVLAMTIIRSTRLARLSSWMPVALTATAAVGVALAAPAAVATLTILLVAASATLAIAAWGRAPLAARVAGLAATLVLALVTSALSPATTGVWAFILLVLLLLFVTRALASRGRLPGATGVLVAASTTALVVILGAGVVVGPWWSTLGTATTLPDPLGVTLAGSAVLILLAVAGARVTRSESVVAGPIAAVSTLSAWALLRVAYGDPVDVGWRIAAAAVLLAAALAWARPAHPRVSRAVGIVSAIPLGAALAAEVSVLFDDGYPGGLGATAAATVLALIAGVRAARRPRVPAASSGVDSAADASLLTTVGVVLVAVVADAGESVPLALLVLAATPVLVAFRPRTEPSSMRRIAWAGAALAVASLWSFLADRSVDVVEYYTLPVAGLLLAVVGVSTVGDARHDRPAAAPPRRAGSEAILACAAAIGLVPSALTISDQTSARALVIAVAGVLLLVLALVVLRDGSGIRARTIAWFAGVAALALPVSARMAAGDDRYGPGDGPESLWWLAAVTIVLLGAAVAILRFRRAPILATTAAIASSLTIVVTVAALLTRAQLDGVGALPWLVVLCVTAVISTTGSRTSASVAAIVASTAAVAVGAGMVDTVPHIEVVSVPLGVAAVAAGALRLRRDPAARSWPMVGPGLLLLLLPSLARDLGDTTLWRVIAVGVTGVLVLLVGVRWRLQAPLVIGASTVILHGIAQLWPWISDLYEAGYWWLWAGIGGVVLIVFAARYEQRLQNLRDARNALIALR
jgi:hypothetical protein